MLFKYALYYYNVSGKSYMDRYFLKQIYIIKKLGSNSTSVNFKTFPFIKPTLSSLVDFF